MIDLEQTFSSLLDKLAAWLDAAILMLPNLVVAVLVLLAFIFAARFARRIVVHTMRRFCSIKQVNELVATTVYIILFAAGLFIALGILDLDKTVTSLLAGAGIIGLALGFAFQDIASNFIAGILLSVRRPFVEGEIIETNDYQGVVEIVNLRATEIRTFQGHTVIIPNKEVFQNPLVNYSRTGLRRIDLTCGVAYGDDLERAREVAVEAITRLGIHDPERPVDLYYDGFGDSSINFCIRFWVDFRQQVDFLRARSEAIIALKRAFDDAGITIPFPIRTLDFGVVGGEKLSEVLPRRFYEHNGPVAPKA